MQEEGRLMPTILWQKNGAETKVGGGMTRGGEKRLGDGNGLITDKY